ncbi:MAG: DUF1284 domain-containing protein [Ruminococcus sp.]|nr:DUF1284 domain-containing protein [Ruminococcus sp.]
MQIYKIRPHHALCIQFFEGKGYSPEFTENMRNIINILESSDPFVCITKNADVICSKCPHNINGVCASEKVLHYDNAVMENCSLEINSVIKWSKLKKFAEKIISCGLENICADCKWFYICKK